MSNIQALKRRITTAKNIKQITKAMEMVSASKMRRAQSQALASRPYNQKLQSTLLTIASLSSNRKHPLLKVNQSGKHLIMLMSTDRSLAGSLNTNLFRGVSEYIDSLPQTEEVAFIIVGQKARRFVVSGGYELLAEYINLKDPASLQDAQAIAHYVIDGYTRLQFSSVTVMYMDFESTLVQRIKYFDLLPITRNWESLFSGTDDILESGANINKNYLFEPSSDQIFSWLLPYYVEQVIYQTLMETRASEHSARMVAMKNASDNAGEIITDLTLQFNKQRQTKITTELLDNITASTIVSV